MNSNLCRDGHMIIGYLHKLSTVQDGAVWMLPVYHFSTAYDYVDYVVGSKEED